MTRTRRPALGLRREVLILLPVALLLLVVLSTFTLFSFRNALNLLAEERRAEAVRLAEGIAGRLAGTLPSQAELRSLAPQARGIAVANREGEALVSAGEIPSAGLFTPFVGDVLAAGPDEALPDRIAGRAPFGDGRWVRVDLAAEVLPAQQRAVGVLSVVVLGLNAALLLLVLSFLRHLMVPWETLIERARQMGAEQEPGEGEIEFLLATFERAITAAAQTRTPEDDIEALERTLSASLQSGLLLLDRAGNVLAFNAVAAALLGIEPPPPGTPLAKALATQPELLSLLESAVADRSAPKRQEISVQTGGEARTLGLTVHPLRRDDGGIRGWLVLFADLTEVQRLAGESRLAESLARLGEMAGGVAHELRNSLATLRGYLTLIERRPDEESIADYLAEIRHEADHLERVLEDFLAFARPGSARFQELSLTRLARRAAADPSLGGMEVRVTSDADINMRGDAQLLERALRNLLHNAAQAEREAGGNGPVELRIVGMEAGLDGVELAVEDRGPGLPPEMRERLFHPFATGRRGGVGLGLALAHRIVTLHGGRIRLEDRPGGGTRALLSFPRDTIVTIGSETASS
ncbi:MAG: two-component system, NtrC family, sensor histidine kinase AtoS [Acidobacteriota bacterium]|jgi:signal transduction histidine kinase|nr:two-component system, NtrC family, sensor histidine kinase AtoS [Acidobacteriota bacterium]